MLTYSNTAKSWTEIMCFWYDFFLVLTFICPYTFGSDRFTQEPPNKVYVSKGANATLVWDYDVQDMDNMGAQSPRWDFYGSSRKTIGYVVSQNNYKFYIHPDCPPRLTTPTVRVGQKSKATLVISNVTTADDGEYGCTLVLVGGDITSRVNLIVTDAKPHFIKVPPSIMYVTSGQAAKFVWEYAVGNKTSVFDPQSPRWEVYNNNSGWKTIAADHGTSGWQWKLSSSCPARLQNPIRVSKASSASLVIYNVTTEDSGIYRCNLTLKHRPSVASTVRLIVTARPHFSSWPSSTMNIAEGQHLHTLCSAVGPPTPNVTWVKVQGILKVTISKGTGIATLSFPNIQRNQDGVYECQAVNNPNQSPVTTQTKINVMYPPSIDNSKSDTTVISVPGIATLLRCVVSGFPIPNVTWYNNRQPIKQSVTSYAGFSEVTINIENAKGYRIYTCFAENILGYRKHNVTVAPYKSNAADHHTSKSKGTIDYGRDPVVITCVVIIAVLIAVILICVFKLRGNIKKKRDSTHKDIINMQEIQIPSPSRSTIHDEMPNSAQTLDGIDNDLPVDVSTASAAGPSDAIYPYEIPQINFGQDASASTSPPDHYQELNLIETSTHNYQSLQGIRSTANPSLESEASNAYEPLKTDEPQYQQLNRH